MTVTEPVAEPSSTQGKPLTKRGAATRAKIVIAAEEIFAKYGYHEASIVKITESAGIGLGTFYLYFDSKKSVFEALVEDLNRRVRHSMTEAMAGTTNRIDAERAGFEGFFAFTAEHPALYRVVREAEFVSPESMRMHYSKIVQGYQEGLIKAAANGEIDAELDPEMSAWALMGIGELIGMRYILWENMMSGGETTKLSDEKLDAMMRFINNALAPHNSKAELTKQIELGESS